MLFVKLNAMVRKISTLAVLDSAPHAKISPQGRMQPTTCPAVVPRRFLEVEFQPAQGSCMGSVAGTTSHQRELKPAGLFW